MYSAERTKAMLDAIDAADLVLLAFPLYVDSLPAPVMNALEHIASHRATQRENQATSIFAAIIELRIFLSRITNATALRSAKTFARLTHFEWAGSLAFGCRRRDGAWYAVERVGWTRHSIEEALDLSAESLARA